MKIDFIKRGAETRLILIFAGWSTGVEYYNDCVFPGWDTAVVYDYRDLELPDMISQYSTIYVFAYSLGVWAASMVPIDAAVRIAVCGTSLPVSDEYGIPEAIFKATADNLSDASLLKFQRRMAGGKSEYQRLKERLPEGADIRALKEELLFIAQCSVENAGCSRWHRAYIAEKDAIFPLSNQINFWRSRGVMSVVIPQASHAIELQDVIQSCLPDKGAISSSFTKAAEQYNKTAVVQSEVCDIIIAKLRELSDENLFRPDTLLEIGAGMGMLTRKWAEILTPASATFIDLCKMPEFRVAGKEEYIVGDAEAVMRESNRKFDLILSASTIQWFADPIGFLKSVRTYLNPGGCAVISTFISGNLGELESLRPSPILYRDEDEYIDAGADEYISFKRTLHFASARQMLMHLKNSGVSPSKSRSNQNTIPLSDYPSSLTYTPAILIFRN